MKQLGIKDEDALQSYFIKRIDTFLTEHHRRTIGWDEILEGGLAPNAAVMSWHGVAGGIAAAKQGHDAVLTPVRPLYFNYRQEAIRTCRNKRTITLTINNHRSHNKDREKKVSHIISQLV